MRTINIMPVIFYPCPFCNALFGMKKYLITHVKKCEDRSNYVPDNKFKIRFLKRKA